MLEEYPLFYFKIAYFLRVGFCILRDARLFSSSPLLTTVAPPYLIFYFFFAFGSSSIFVGESCRSFEIFLLYPDMLEAIKTG